MSDILFQPLGDPIAGGDNLQSLADIDPRMTRTHYFDGRLLTAEDLERDQIYLDQRLREVGKALGSGIINGLDLSFSTNPHRLIVEPGCAMTPAGRVLQLSTKMTVNPGDRALISQLNTGKYRHLNRGLYAVVLRYVDVPTDIAEVFPTDLSSRTGSDFALVTESVQLGLLPLPLGVPATDVLRVRARLMAELLDNKLANSVIPDDCVALGLLSITNDTPQWVDSELLRHPVRIDPGQDDLQEDLYRQYQSLLDDITGYRAAGSLSQPFAASDYFQVIPPAGRLPKNTVDPQLGLQGYFPESFDVSVTPVRQADLDLIRQESMSLPPIDLGRDTHIGIMVLAPLSDNDYQALSRQLVASMPNIDRHFMRPDPLALRLYPNRASHTLDTDASVWANIWERTDSEKLLYVRRAVRVAETGISAIVLAKGSDPASLPDVPGDGTTEPAPPTTIEDEHTVFLRMVSVQSLAKMRPAGNEEGERAIEALATNLPREPAAIRALLDILLCVEKHYNPVIWQTLEQAHRQSNLPKLRELLIHAEPDVTSTAKRVITAATDFGFADNLLAQWKERLNALR